MAEDKRFTFEDGVSVSKEKLLEAAEDARQLLKKKADTLNALDAVELYMAAGEPIPADLFPHLWKVIEFWKTAKGNRQRVRSRRTQMQKQMTVFTVAQRKVAEQLTVVQAIERVCAEELDESHDVETVEGWYRRKEFELFREFGKRAGELQLSRSTNKESSR